MKFEVTLLTILFMVGSAGIISAAPCDLETTLLNQDPYPAVPGDYVKLVFQVEGYENPECGTLRFELLEDYPLEFDPGETGLRTFNKVTFIRDYESSILIPFEVRINDEALDGENPIEARIEDGFADYLETFNLEIEDVRADFEVYIRDYQYATKTLTLEILNTEDADIEALTVSIPKQDSIVIKGPPTVIVGDLDSNEYTTADFEATPRNGEITITLTYTDSINVRREVTKTVMFDESYFTGRAGEETSTSAGTYVVVTLLIIGLIYWFYRRRKKKRHAHHTHHKK